MGLLLPSDFIDVLCNLDRSRAVGRRILEEALRDYCKLEPGAFL